MELVVIDLSVIKNDFYELWICEKIKSLSNLFHMKYSLERSPMVELCYFHCLCAWQELMYYTFSGNTTEEVNTNVVLSKKVKLCHKENDCITAASKALLRLASS